eukprot:1142310-Pelagomonas_calceolata.AAC.1
MLLWERQVGKASQAILKNWQSYPFKALSHDSRIAMHKTTTEHAMMKILLLSARPPPGPGLRICTSTRMLSEPVPSGAISWGRGWAVYLWPRTAKGCLALTKNCRDVLKASTTPSAASPAPQTHFAWPARQASGRDWRWVARPATGVQRVNSGKLANLGPHAS